MLDNQNISAFFQNINIEKMRLTDIPLFVFFCGGENHINVDRGIDYIPSMRHIVLKKIESDFPELFRQIILAETFQDWLNQDIDITNLIDLERFLAELATLVVLIVEAPGAYAELGAFSVIDSIQKKLLPIINTSIIQERSFINFGPIDFLKNERKECDISELNWKVKLEIHNDQIISSIDDTDSNLTDTVDVIISDIYESIDKNNIDSPLFNPNQCGHVYILIHEIVYILQAALAKEIKQILMDFFDIDYQTKEIRKILYVLSKLDFIEISKIKKNDNLYYLSKKDHSLFKYSYITKDDSLTKEGFISKLQFYYYSEVKEKRRLLAINNREQGD